MFAEFELATHDAVQRGEAMTGRRLTQLYCELLGRYHGQAQGVMTLDPVVCSEWAYIPHFYRPFYVYQYATSMAAASHFTQRILAGGEREREAYLDVLRAGGAVHPVPLLQRAGLDMTSPEPYRALVARMDALIDEMERLLAP
jgi:oligoendopeptidase F